MLLVVISFAACAGVVFLIFWLLDKWFAHLSSSDKPAAITALGVVVVAVITYVFNRGADRRRVLEEVTRRQKIELYAEIVEFVTKQVLTNQTGQASSEELQAFFAKVTPRLITFGSNAVVKRWGKYIRGIPALTQLGTWQLLMGYEGVLKAMRKDVGHSPFTLQDGDLSRLFINDIDETIAQRKKLRARLWTSRLHNQVSNAGSNGV